MKTTDAAVGKWHGILTAFGVGEEFLRNRHGPCPLCGGTDRFRFDDKKGLGTWYCNQCGHGTGIDLLKKITGRKFSELATEIDRMVGNISADVKPEQKDPAERLRKIQAGTRMIAAGDEVSKYLSGRGLSVPRLGIRIHQSIPYWEDGKIKQHYPAMVAVFTSREGKPVTYHLTYLENGKKAPVNPCRKILPPTQRMGGGAVRLFPVADHIGIAEGIETALAAAAMYQVPVWAATSAGLLEAFSPPEGVKSVAIFGDNDASWTGQAAACVLAKKLTARGISAQVYLPPKAGQDYCDILAESANSSSVS